MYAAIIRGQRGPDEIGRLTDRQIDRLYRKRDEDEGDDIPEPETEEELRELLAGLCHQQGIPKEKQAEIIERQVEKWKTHRGQINNQSGTGGP